MSENSSVKLVGITPLQQMLASGTGALFTSLFGRYIVNSSIIWNNLKYVHACKKMCTISPQITIALGTENSVAKQPSGKVQCCLAMAVSAVLVAIFKWGPCSLLSEDLMWSQLPAIFFIDFACGKESRKHWKLWSCGSGSLQHHICEPGTEFLGWNHVTAEMQHWLELWGHTHFLSPP